MNTRKTRPHHSHSFAMIELAERKEGKGSRSRTTG